MDRCGKHGGFQRIEDTLFLSILDCCSAGEFAFKLSSLKLSSFVPATRSLWSIQTINSSILLALYTVIVFYSISYSNTWSDVLLPSCMFNSTNGLTVWHGMHLLLCGKFRCVDSGIPTSIASVAECERNQCSLWVQKKYSEGTLSKHIWPSQT